MAMSALNQWWGRQNQAFASAPRRWQYGLGNALNQIAPMGTSAAEQQFSTIQGFPTSANGMPVTPMGKPVPGYRPMVAPVAPPMTQPAPQAPGYVPTPQYNYNVRPTHWWRQAVASGADPKAAAMQMIESIGYRPGTRDMRTPEQKTMAVRRFLEQVGFDMTKA